MDSSSVGTGSSGLLDEATARKRLAASSIIQYRYGLTDYLGHTSVRLEGDRVLIKPKHSPTVMAMDSLGPEDFIVIDLDGRGESGPPPPAEVFIHTEILRSRPDVNVVVHTHQPNALTLGVLGAPVLPLIHVQSPLVEDPVPIWPCPLLVTTQERGASLARALGEHRVAMLQGHGIVSVSSSIEEATINAIHLEQLAVVNLEVLRTGLAPRVIPQEEIATLREELAPVRGRWAYYASIFGVDAGLLA